MNYNREDFEILYKTRYRQMYRVAYLILQDEEDARDVVSQVFAQLLQRQSRFEDEDLTAYLLASTRNRSLNTLRDRRPHVALTTDMAGGIPEQAEEHDELTAELRRLIREELSPQDQRILALRYDEELSYAETAEMLGISTAAVNKHVTRSFAKLRKLLKKR
ncbi:MAG: sigma-70 family RNA polymerase sigma factor [Bacteroidales bacterium]|nr:sigma-70 family RNA polymerase sigma factor [Bacteroidales bacterium]